MESNTVKRLQKAETNSRRLASIFNDYLVNHPDKWVGVADGRIFGPADSVEQLYDMMRQAGADTTTADLEYTNSKLLDPNLVSLF